MNNEEFKIDWGDFTNPNLLTEEEKEERDGYLKAIERYEKRFGKNYGLYVGVDGWKSTREQIEEIEECLRTGKPKSPPNYEPDAIY